MDHVLVYNTIKTRVASCVHASRDERELDQERRCALRLEIDGNVIGIERMSISVTGRERIRDRSTKRKCVSYRPKTPPVRPWLIAVWVSTAV